MLEPVISFFEKKVSSIRTVLSFFVSVYMMATLPVWPKKKAHENLADLCNFLGSPQLSSMINRAFHFFGSCYADISWPGAGVNFIIRAWFGLAVLGVIYGFRRPVSNFLPPGVSACCFFVCFIKDISAQSWLFGIWTLVIVIVSIAVCSVYCAKGMSVKSRFQVAAKDLGLLAIAILSALFFAVGVPILWSIGIFQEKKS